MINLLDNLILAYRKEFYDWNRESISKFLKKNKKLLFAVFVFILLFIITISCSLIFHTNIGMFAFLLLELFLGIAGDHLMVKRSPKFISEKQEHINEVVSFLKIAIPENNLFCKKQIEELISRLSDRIEAGAPFNKFKLRLSNFGKVIILPTFTYIAGLYTSFLGQLEFTVVAAWALSIILVVGLIYITLGMLAQGIQKITCRNYDAAIALKEDLLDIKMLCFIGNDE